MFNLRNYLKTTILGLMFGLSSFFGFYIMVNAWQAIDVTNTIDTSLNAESNDPLTVDKWNAMVQRMSGVYTDGTGKVGVGTISPTGNLHIYSTSGYPELKIESNQVGGGNLRLVGLNGSTQIYQEGTNLKLQVGSAQVMALTSGGFAGIGTISPGRKLHVYQESTDNVVGLFESSDYSSYIEFRDDTTGFQDVLIGAVASDFRVIAGGGEVIRAASSGNVGIGNASPAHTLHLKDSADIYLPSVAPNSSSILFHSENYGIKLRAQNDGAGEARFFIEGGAGAGVYNKKFVVERDSGNVGIGVADPNVKLDVNGAIQLGTALPTCNADTIGTIAIDGSSYATSHESAVPCACIYDDNTAPNYYWTSLIHHNVGTATDCF